MPILEIILLQTLTSVALGSTSKSISKLTHYRKPRSSPFTGTDRPAFLCTGSTRRDGGERVGGHADGEVFGEKSGATEGLGAGSVSPAVAD
jgi:hypothetical protein